LVVKEYIKPKTLNKAYELLKQNKRNYIIGGGAWIKLTLKSVETFISLDDLNLNKVEETDKEIIIGAMTTLHDIEGNESINNLYNGLLAKACHSIMGMNVRNIATIGGSIMGRLAFSDIYPVLLVLNTTLVFHNAGEIKFSDFLDNPRMERDILVKIKIIKESGKGFFKKVSNTPLDFALINFAITNGKSGYKISIGSTPYIAKRALKTETYLNNIKTINAENLDKAVNIALEELKFSDNIRGSKAYRIELTKAYIKRGIKQVMNYVG